MTDPAGPFPEALHGMPDAHVDPGGSAPGLLLEGTDGPLDLGPATVDSDADGRPDTAVGVVGDSLLLGTDLDGDAGVDVLTTLGGDGTALTRELPPPGPRAAWDEGEAPPAPTIDPATGHWIRGS